MSPNIGSIPRARGAPDLAAITGAETRHRRRHPAHHLKRRGAARLTQVRDRG
jgi:hypothetical protein